MATKQAQQVVPPIASDKSLTDYSAIIQNNLAALYLLAHKHVGVNGVLTAAPSKNQGNIGDILIAVVSGSAYIYIKTSDTQWYRFGPGTAI